MHRTIAVEFADFMLVNVYAPNDYKDRELFYTALQQWSWQGKDSILASDLIVCNARSSTASGSYGPEGLRTRRSSGSFSVFGWRTRVRLWTQTTMTTRPWTRRLSSRIGDQVRIAVSTDLRAAILDSSRPGGFSRGAISTFRPPMGAAAHSGM